MLAVLKFKLRRPLIRERTRPLTILKPMSGLDANLEKCVESFLKLDSMLGDELIFCFESPLDPAYAVVCKLVKELGGGNQKVSASIAPLKRTANPKINNIWQAYRETKNDLIIISDSNVIAPRNYRAVMDHEFVGVGVLTSVVYSTGNGLDAAMLNTFNAKWLLILNFLRQSTVVGKSMMFSRGSLERLGGFREAGEFMAEDYAIGRIFRRSGFKIKISSVPVMQSISHSGGFWGRYLRWGVMRKAHASFAFIYEPLLYGFVVQALIGFKYGWISAFVLGSFWGACDAIICAAVSGTRLPFVAYTIREWSALPMWVHTLFSNHVNWRGKKYLVVTGGRAYLEK